MTTLKAEIISTVEFLQSTWEPLRTAQDATTEPDARFALDELHTQAIFAGPIADPLLPTDTVLELTHAPTSWDDIALTARRHFEALGQLMPAEPDPDLLRFYSVVLAFAEGAGRYAAAHA